MHVNIGQLGPVFCSKCNSTNAVKPVNESDVLIRCLDCGHEVRATPIPEDATSASWTMTEPPKRNEF